VDKRTIIAVIVAAIILFGYQFYIAKVYPDAYKFTAERPQSSGVVDEIGQMPPQEIMATGPQEKALLEKTGFEYITGPEEKVVVETDIYIVTLTNIGGCIKSIILKDFPDPITKEYLKIVEASIPEECIFNLDGFDDRNMPRLTYQAEKVGYEVIFSAIAKNGVHIKKRYSFDKTAHHIELNLYFYNPAVTRTMPSYSIVAASNINIPTRLDRRYAQIVSEISGKSRRDNGKKGEGVFVEGIVSYSGLQNKYFSVLAKPTAPSRGVTLMQTGDNNLLSSIEIGKFSIEPQSGASHNYLLFVGPTKRALLKEYNLSGSVSYGFFGGISQVLVMGLVLFQRIFRNWGVAIILLSALVNIILFPLSRKSYQSMKKMQEIQPHVEKLRNDHKDNPTKLNKETMELYKKYNVNPMGGCLPMFLQIPVFIALYQALMRSIELRGARFLWIRDLSMPDAVPLPFSLPMVGDSINILPILMAGAMVFQQKASMRKGAAESSQAKQQQQMMVLMPVIFLFIMYSFPSGLVLYWLTNTLLTMYEQRAIMRG